MRKGKGHEETVKPIFVFLRTWLRVLRLMAADLVVAPIGHEGNTALGTFSQT